MRSPPRARKKNADTLVEKVRAEQRRWSKTANAPGDHLRITGGAARLCEEPGFRDIHLPPGWIPTPKGCFRCAEVQAIALRELGDWLTHDAEWLLHKEANDGLDWDQFEDVDSRQTWRADAVSYCWDGYSEERNQARFEASIFGDDDFDDG